MERARTCCFTGHRRLSKEKIGSILLRLNQAVDTLIAQGITDFISGGALGFDQMAASLVIAKKAIGNPLRLIFALPCKNQDEFWSADQKKLYCDLLAEADEVIYVSEAYTRGCMKKRNRFMVDRSAYCICAWLHPLSGSDQTIGYAGQRGTTVIHTAGEEGSAKRKPAP